MNEFCMSFRLRTQLELIRNESPKISQKSQLEQEVEGKLKMFS